MRASTQPRGRGCWHSRSAPAKDAERVGGNQPRCRELKRRPRGTGPPRPPPGPARRFLPPRRVRAGAAESAAPPVSVRLVGLGRGSPDARGAGSGAGSTAVVAVPAPDSGAGTAGVAVDAVSGWVAVADRMWVLFGMIDGPFLVWVGRHEEAGPARIVRNSPPSTGYGGSTAIARSRRRLVRMTKETKPSR